MAAITLPGRRSGPLRRLLRYASVSVVSTATGLTVLGLLVGVAGVPAVWANVVATAVGTVPSFELNRRFVWCVRGERPRLAQIVPFCLLSFSGLVVSSVAVHVAGDATAADSRLVHTAAVELGNVAAYGALWVVQFLLCDRLLFRRAPAPADSQPAFSGGPRHDQAGAVDWEHDHHGSRS